MDYLFHVIILDSDKLYESLPQRFGQFPTTTLFLIEFVVLSFETGSASVFVEGLLILEELYVVLGVNGLEHSWCFVVFNKWL